MMAAVVAGDPSKPGPFVIRAKLPDGYKVPSHSHPDDENVTVLSGTLMAGKGDKLGADSAVALPTGSFVRMPKGMHHFVWAKGETVIQIHGTGPFQITYVNPSDDPRKK
jgi:quercetin dioxygenase-like cupin family protein